MRKALFVGLSFLSILSYAQDKNKEMSPKDTEMWDPVPPVVTANKNNAAPSDAIVLFDGSDLTQWINAKNSKPAKWKINKDGSMTVVGKNNGGGSIKTKDNFGSIQLHLEWRSPELDKSRKGQQRGNSGVFIQGRYEVQILDNNNNPTYSNGQVSSVYKQTIPLAKASVPTGEWNTYDIIYHAPEFNKDKSLKSPATITILHNGILTIDHFELLGPTKYIGIPEYSAHRDAPLTLQDHGSPVSYRNIWLRKL